MEGTKKAAEAVRQIYIAVASDSCVVFVESTMMATSRHIFGSHTVDNGGIDQAVRRAAAAGLNAVQIFSAIPKYYGERVVPGAAS
jgi:hypothetical protein